MVQFDHHVYSGKNITHLHEVSLPYRVNTMLNVVIMHNKAAIAGYRSV